MLEVTIEESIADGPNAFRVKINGKYIFNADGEICVFHPNIGSMMEQKQEAARLQNAFFILANGMRLSPRKSTLIIDAPYTVVPDAVPPNSLVVSTK